MMGMIRDFIRGRIESCCSTMFELLKVKAAITYLSIVRGLRRFVLMILALVFCAVVLACGFLLVPIALLMFAPWEPMTKAIVGIAIGAAYVLIPVIVISVLLSERRWLKISRAEDLLRSVKAWK